MADTQRTSRDLIRLEGEAADPVLAYVTDPGERLTRDLVRLEGEPTEPLAVYRTDPADRIQIWGGGGIRAEGLDLGAIARAGASILHAVSTATTFTAVSAASLHLLHLDALAAAGIGLAAAFGGNVALHITRRNRHTPRPPQTPPTETPHN
jgi:hypothetical protein